MTTRRRHIVLTASAVSIITGLAFQQPARFTGATVLWLAGAIALSLVVSNSTRRTAVKNIAELATGSLVIVNRQTGPLIKTYDAIYLGSTGAGATVQIVGTFLNTLTVAWDDRNAWLEDPRTGQTYALHTEEPVLVGAVPDRE